MSDADIDKAVKEAAEVRGLRTRREKKRSMREMKQTPMVFQTEKALKDVGDKLDANDKAAVEADVQALKDVLAKSTPETAADADVC